MARVSFDNKVSVRLHETVLGAHPSTKRGPSVSLGWAYASQEMALQDHDDLHDDLDLYESKIYSRRRGMRLSMEDRVARLAEFGVTVDEMMEDITDIKKVQCSRKMSCRRSKRRQSQCLRCMQRQLEEEEYKLWELMYF